MSWYMEIPVVSRVYLTGAFLTTAMCALDIISPFYLYFNWDLVVTHGQLWRLVTSYLYFGLFSIDYLFHMYFLVRRCGLSFCECLVSENGRILPLITHQCVAPFPLYGTISVILLTL